MGKFIKKLFMAAGLTAMAVAAVCCMNINAEAAGIPGLENNRYVTLSPDGRAFTIGYGDKTVQNYSSADLGKTVTARGFLGIADNEEGRHTYKGVVCGAVPVAYWKLGMTQGKCVHSIGVNYRINLLNLMGANSCNCYRNYNAGWYPYCAVCGERISNLLFYMTEDMAAETKYLPSGITGATYFYLCPFDNSLENHNSIKHVCTQMSTNRYRVQYNGNGENITGSMPEDIFYYYPGENYEGNTVNAQEGLTVCGFEKENYRFVGWSTEEDGDAVIGDGEKWVSVREVAKAGTLPNDSVIKLYAVWEKNEEGADEPTEDVDDLILETNIERVLFASDGEVTFLRGESGDLNINVSGNPERVIVEFPEGLENYNCTFEYTDSGKTEFDGESEELGRAEDDGKAGDDGKSGDVCKLGYNEKIRFMIPIDGIDESAEMLTVKVTAYRGEKCVTNYPVIMLRKSGSVLDELRTCLR